MITDKSETEWDRAR